MQDVMAEFYDGPHATPPPATEGAIYLGIKNMTEDGHLDLSEIRHIAESDYGTWTRRVEPRPGDVIFTYEASLHRYAVIPEGFRGTLGRRVALLRPRPDVVDTKFLLYSFISPAWRATVQRRINLGSTVDRLPLTDFPSFPIRLPPLDTQARIAAVLSAYDDLIENNNRRIKLLEEMAQRIYGEWFVDFRYPGHEEVPIVGSELGPIPDGWSVESLPRVATVNYGKNLPSADLDDTGRFPVYGAAKIIGRHSVMNVNKRTIIMGCRGSCGEVAITEAQAFVTNNSFTVSTTDSAMYYTFLLLRMRGVGEFITGSAQPQITLTNINQLRLILPPSPLLENFHSLAAPLFELAYLLDKGSANLRATRDLLLPRLISGEIDVTDLNVSMAEAVA